MMKSKAYLIASLLDDCDDRKMKVNCDSEDEPLELTSREKIDRDVTGCSHQEEQMMHKFLGTPCRDLVPLPMMRHEMRILSDNILPQSLPYRLPLPLHLQGLSPYNLINLQYSTRTQLIQMQQAVGQQWSSSSATPPSSSLSSLSLPLPSSSSSSISPVPLANSHMIPSGEINFKFRRNLHHRQHHYRVLNDNQSNIKKYRCDICEKTFSRSNTLVTHKVYSSL
ncbi:unnamed protein product [Thelazia callipaeda]|uniref:C2H2-type domain-containing protein n=1 Tax=Thelazia callipaeda TaxID=103827 RepID=A0A0N5CRZ6_THECL|nr:unnamed protein product [Thelazia callipaeda]